MTAENRTPAQTAALARVLGDATTVAAQQQAELAPGTRVARRIHPATRGTVTALRGGSVSVAVDGGGSDSAPAHFRSWRALTADELAEEAADTAADGPLYGPGGCCNPDCVVTAPHGTHAGPHTTAAQRAAFDAALGLAPAYPGATDERRSFAVCPVCGFTNSMHAGSCPEGLDR